MVILALFVSHAASVPTEFSVLESKVLSSPLEARFLPAVAGTKFTDLDVAPVAAEAAILQEDATGAQQVVFWNIGSGAKGAWPVPKEYRAKALAWHPAERTLFLIARQGDSSRILRVSEGKQGWQAKTIYATRKNLRRLVAGPRPFDRDSGSYYRLFLGEEQAGGKFAILSLNEYGRYPYYAVATSGIRNPVDDMDISASDVSASSALPMAFHPAGHVFLWERADHCFEAMSYSNAWGGESKPLQGGKLCQGSVTITPNGLGLLHWQAGIAGVDLVLDGGKRIDKLAEGISFAFTPSSTADGRGLVGVVKSGARYQASYVPVKVPLPDVINAWMFAETEDDINRLAKSGGLFRRTDFAQMYNLYDTEAYACGTSYDQTIPTRPYLVTTDALWEVFAAAFEGLFVTAEKQQAIPAFWEFVRLAAAETRTRAQTSRWARLFDVLERYRTGEADKAGETARIDSAKASARSSVFEKAVDFSILKPRGNYASNPGFRKYFKAVTYLTRFPEQKWFGDRDLKDLSPAVRARALDWIRAYQPFISAGRNSLVWDTASFRPPSYNKHPETGMALFPLSWGMDNEILNSVVNHPDWPAEDQIKSPGGARMMPTSLDLPSAMGNPLAAQLSAENYARYPRLLAIVADLRARPWQLSQDSLNLYQAWLAALRVQWGPVRSYPSASQEWSVWGPKRLQTGLASWATLRHATVLVNDEGGAECGEGGYEEIRLRPPRGYVEPDPAAFLALAGLFDKARMNLDAGLQLTGSANLDPEGKKEPLHKGLQDRLGISAGAARRFAAMAEKELQGQDLAEAEYQEILEFGRVAEHHFLLYKSLSSQGLGLPTPDPIPKIADVAKGPNGKSRLFAAVGKPLEWDQIVPYFGRRELVKGAVYSYYELVSDTIYNDKEWQASLSHHTRPDWIAPNVIDRELACPARAPF